MVVSDGVNGREVSMMWDVLRVYCTGFINCPDLYNDQDCMNYMFPNNPPPMPER